MNRLTRRLKHPFTGRPKLAPVRALPRNPEEKTVRVFVEGYEDVAFWRGVFDGLPTRGVRFEISVPTGRNLPKGKKVLLGMLPESSDELLLCVDSDFDHLFDGYTAQSKLVNDSPYLFHTYTYATENYLCYAPSLHNVCVKATKNDTRIFDFEVFLAAYSRIIYRLFVWYAYSALKSAEHLFTLADFKTSVRIHYLDLECNGEKTLEWLQRNVARREASLAAHYSDHQDELANFEQLLARRGVRPEDTYLYMHGHTLMDNVVMVALTAVCERLREMSLARIDSSSKQGVALKNEISNYQNAQRSIRDVLLDNENYTACPLYKRLREDLERYIGRMCPPMPAAASDAAHAAHGFGAEGEKAQ